MPFKYNIETARQIFAASGYTLISGVYIGCRDILKYLCPNGHAGESSLFDFLQGYGRCACFCSRKAWAGYNFLDSYPYIVKDWDYEMNYPLTPVQLTPGSKKSVWWKCDKCSVKHSYKQQAYGHAVNKRECPYYLGRRVGYGNDLYTNYKDMCDVEWDWEKNEVLPNEITPKASARVWWKCFKCDVLHSYKMRVAEKTSGSNCPYRAGKKVGFGNSLLNRYPHVASEWDFDRNEKGPDVYTFGSHIKAYFKHLTDEGDIHRWKATIKNRTLGSTGCPLCVLGDISKISQRWLDGLNIPSLQREYKVLVKGRRYKFDGFDPVTNTVYEFLGDYWHGNPEIYNKKDLNGRNNKTFGFLYKETIEKIRFLESCGYKVVYIWETDFMKEL